MCDAAAGRGTRRTLWDVLMLLLLLYEFFCVMKDTELLLLLYESFCV